jgi:hemolysin activation/secretion protein
MEFLAMRIQFIFCILQTPLEKRFALRLGLAVVLSFGVNPQLLQAQEAKRQGFASPVVQASGEGDSQSPSRDPLTESEPRQLPVSPEFAPPATPDSSEELLREIPGTITIERFEVIGSTVFSQAEFDELLRSYTNRPLSFAELLEARSAVTDFYLRQGYITSGAIIPPQELTGEVVQIQVVEGGLEAIKVNMEGRLNPAYVRERLEIATETPLNVNRLQEALQLLQLDERIRSLSAELSAGPEAGLSLLTVDVVTAETFDLTVLVDNGRSPSVGSIRRRIFLEEANFLDIGDKVLASYTNTEGSDALDFSYTLPIDPQNGTLRLAYGRTDSKIVEDPFTPLDIQSELRYYELSLRQPVILTPTQELAIGVTASRQNSVNFLLGRRFPLSTGADEEGKTQVSVLRFFQEWTQREEGQVIAARSQFSVGVDWFDATTNENAPDSRFFAWRGQGQWVRLLAEDTLLLVRTDLQLASQALVPLEQFGLGGIESVRGYRQDVLLSDSGWLASAEVRLPIWRKEEWDSILQVTPFVDLGAAWNVDRNGGDRAQPDPNFIAGTGLGLRWQTGDHFTATLEYGLPLVEVESQGDSLQEDGIYFSLIYNFL